MRTEEEVNRMIEDMVNRTKGKYITQGVTFNKSCPRQMGLLKKALMSSASFSGLGKELLAIKFEGGANHIAPSPQLITETEPRSKDIGNFL